MEKEERPRGRSVRPSAFLLPWTSSWEIQPPPIHTPDSRGPRGSVTSAWGMGSLGWWYARSAYALTFHLRVSAVYGYPLGINNTELPPCRSTKPVLLPTLEAASVLSNEYSMR